MARRKRTVAMLLAGGQGSRLGVLTATRAKPAVTYGGKYHIIDFPLSNCTHSNIDTVGVLTQYRPLELNTYLSTGSAWDLDTMDGGLFVLPPFVKEKSGAWYSGTANAIYQNIDFIDHYDPETLVILSGDHIYKMNYKWMIDFHREKEADATISVISVPLEEASRFGIMNANDDMRIVEFEEKPLRPKSTLASMGVYAFNWDVIRKYLIKDVEDPDSEGDFGKNIIPAMLAAGEKIYAYNFGGYWKDVGTVESLWEANMELLTDFPPLNLYDDPWKIYSRNWSDPPQFIDESAEISNSIICEGCRIYGTVEHSVLSSGVIVGKGAVVRDSIIMKDTTIEEGAAVNMSIIDEEVVVGAECVIGAHHESGEDKRITTIGKSVTLEKGRRVEAGEEVRHDS
ncbi:MAG: glucose-1-phosphate adenylyltransferase [Clostridiales Family XIII bacterium]|jgi:glucose-1-phosphate adenylyltransferase|nr:glucose-1-phosphate adenylyltransferase [Clostridiales Family XIII bacterium]